MADSNNGFIKRNPILAVAGVIVAGVVAWTVISPGEEPSDTNGGPAGSPGPTASASLQDPSGSPTATGTPAGSEDPTADSSPATGAPRTADGARITDYPYPDVPTRGNVPAADLDQAVEDATQVASAAVQAYSSTTYRDQQPGAWVARMKPYTSTDYQRALQREYANADGGMTWTQMREEKYDARTSVDSVDLTDFYDHNGARLVLVVTFYKSTRTDSTDWTEPVSPFQKFVEMELDTRGHWKVVDVRDTSDRSE